MTTKETRYLMRSLLALFLALTALSLACTSAQTVPSKPVVRIASTNFSEQVTLAELYGQMLEAHGYTVERHFNLGNREVVAPALQAGQVDLYIEYLATMLRYVDRDAQPSADPQATHQALQTALQRTGLAVLAYAPAVDTNAFAVTRRTAAQYGLSKLSDLQPVADQLVLGGPPECARRPFCLPGLQETYGLRFKAFKALDALGPLTLAAIEDGDIDVGLFGSTDGVVAKRGLVMLEDDRHLQLADNVAPVVRADLLAKVPAEFPQLLDRVSAELTTSELVGLNTTVDVERQPVTDVTRAWLRSKSLVR
jgi:osmoprotectant transport system substrate-binding protein